MLMRNECAVCILNQIIRATDYMGLDKTKSDLIFNEALRKTIETGYTGMTPPFFSGKIYNAVTSLTGNNDPYKKLRKEQNDLILDNIQLFRSRITGSDDPLFTSLFYSLLGNIIDYGGVEIFDTDQIFSDVKEIGITVNDYNKLKERLDEAGSMLIISDNAGEAVFDMLLMEQLKLKFPELEIIYGVRSGPAINDIIKEDAEYIGIGKYAEIVETGSTYAGTMIDDSDQDFIEIYNKADIVISKGQGNYETLEMEKGKDIFFIFKVKCRIVAEHSGLPLNSLVMG
ncbi:MAG: ARMT1-like domain-containing protein, partial [Acidobacteriota bacterium]